MNVIKSIQRGVAASAGDILISAVSLSKSVIRSKSKGSAGYAAASGSITLNKSGGGSIINSNPSQAGYPNNTASFPSYSGDFAGGSTDLTAKQFSARLIDSTHINVDGPCEWQVIEYIGGK